MKCDFVRTQLTAYLDGELTDDRGSAVRGHLRGCDACRQAASDEAALRDGLRSLPPVDPPPTLWAGVQRRLAEEEVADAERPSWRRALARWAPRAPQLGLAGVALAAAVVLIVMRVSRDNESATVQAPTKINPVVIAPERSDPLRTPRPTPLAPDEGDVTAELAAEPARITEQYAQAAQELLAVANDARAQWPVERQRDFDVQLVALQKKIAAAGDERPRKAAYRALIRYLQRATIHDDVALASIGGAP